MLKDVNMWSPTLSLALSQVSSHLILPATHRERWYSLLLAQEVMAHLWLIQNSNPNLSACNHSPTAFLKLSLADLGS